MSRTFARTKTLLPPQLVSGGCEDERVFPVHFKVVLFARETEWGGSIAIPWDLPAGFSPTSLFGSTLNSPWWEAAEPEP